MLFSKNLYLKQLPEYYRFIFIWFILNRDLSYKWYIIQNKIFTNFDSNIRQIFKNIWI